MKSKCKRKQRKSTVNQSQQTDLPEVSSSTTTITTTTESTSNSQSTSSSVPTPSSPSPPATVHLQSNDGRIFTVEVEVARLFGIVQAMLDDSIITSGVNEVEAVPLVHVSGPILELAVTWAKHHQKRNSLRPDQLKQEGTGDGDLVVNNRGNHFDQGAYRGQPSLRSMYKVDPWDAQFLGALTPAKLQAVLEAANYLNCQQLLDSACKMIAQMIKGALSSPDGAEEVTSLLQIPVPPADEERRRKQRSNPPSFFNSSTASLLTNTPQSASKSPVASTSKTTAIKVKTEEESETRWIPLSYAYPSGFPVGHAPTGNASNASRSTCAPSTSAAAQIAEGAAPSNAPVPAAPAMPAPTGS